MYVQVHNACAALLDSYRQYVPSMGGPETPLNYAQKQSHKFPERGSRNSVAISILLPIIGIHCWPIYWINQAPLSQYLKQTLGFSNPAFFHNINS
jgi:hypothetical protein